MPEPADTDWAYAAGMVDGEGCIAIVRSFAPKRGRYYYGVHVVVANRDRNVLAWMQSVWGGYVVGVSGRAAGASAAWSWRSTGPKAKLFLDGIRPWLRIKPAQCDNALEMIDLLQPGKRTLGRTPLPQSWLNEQEAHYWLQRKLNHRGTAVFVKKPMHSPRQISRIRKLAAAQ